MIKAEKEIDQQAATLTGSNNRMVMVKEAASEGSQNRAAAIAAADARNNFGTCWRPNRSTLGDQAGKLISRIKLNIHLVG